MTTETLTASDDFDDDVLLELAQVARMGNMSVTTLRELIHDGRGPWTFWREDCRRWAARLRLGEPGRNRR